MTIILFDTPQARKSFYPFTLTRPIADIRQGILTIKERWALLTEQKIGVLTEPYLQQVLPQDDDFVYVDATLVPTKDLLDTIFSMEKASVWMEGDQVVAYRTQDELTFPVTSADAFPINPAVLIKRFRYPWQLFQTNEQAIKGDFGLLTHDGTSQAIDKTNIVFNESNIFIEEGAEVRACTINAEAGPVYIGKDALVMEGTTIRGPVAICNNAVVKMGSKLYPGTTIGPFCTAGGEIKNSIMMGYSNKAHDGYLGDSVIGEWCNMGAGTTNSNVKNTAGDVKMWSGAADDFVVVGKKAGLLMGDYSRAAINTSFNTGTVVGLCCNVYGNGFPLKHTPSFTWGNDKYDLEKALSDIDRWMQFKNKTITETEQNIVRYLFEKGDADQDESNLTLL